MSAASALTTTTRPPTPAATRTAAEQATLAVDNVFAKGRLLHDADERLDKAYDEWTAHIASASKHRNAVSADRAAELLHAAEAAHHAAEKATAAYAAAAKAAHAALRAARDASSGRAGQA